MWFLGRIKRSAPASDEVDRKDKPLQLRGGCTSAKAIEPIPIHTRAFDGPSLGPRDMTRADFDYRYGRPSGAVVAPGGRPKWGAAYVNNRRGLAGAGAMAGAGIGLGAGTAGAYAGGGSVGCGGGGSGSGCGGGSGGGCGGGGSSGC